VTADRARSGYTVAAPLRFQFTAVDTVDAPVNWSELNTRNHAFEAPAIGVCLVLF
jgi:hypothetical protein